jgi:hypothetical protein
VEQPALPRERSVSSVARKGELATPLGCLSSAYLLDLDIPAKILVDGLFRPIKTGICHLWSRLLQVRALPPSLETAGSA